MYKILIRCLINYRHHQHHKFVIVNSINVLQFISSKNFITSLYFKSNIINHFTLNIQSFLFSCLKSWVDTKISMKTSRTTSLLKHNLPKEFCNDHSDTNEIHYFIRVRFLSTLDKFMCVLMSCKNG